MNAMLLYVCTVFILGEGIVGNELHERVMLERVELIARLTSEGACRERDREIALNLIAEIAANYTLSDNHFSVVFSATPLKK
ncbi:hypothetical protein C7431_103188 [Pantoea allii]|jgi:hypothetical protein|uniref:Uncharacterized protein n=2 Tax=Erwiniaceae TaxID=1903409 RepID=A0A2V2BJC9_9GAMM|nr:hypothetical protein C7431_103188 [Pantoea allii]TWD33746.1 hypothetical protein FBY13_11520 [Pantoea sp. SJZ147]